jgi:glutamate-1-semialdehyde 2,1-aminomutase
MSALRLARAVTGRDRVLKFAGCYHGHVDALLVSAGSGVATLGLPDSPGVPPGTRESTIVASFNSLSALKQIFWEFKPDLAAAIIEPVAANMGVVPPSTGFLKALKTQCEIVGSLLIFDEVVTGFRVGWSGAQGMLGITPDLTVLGKAIGGGLPIGAYGGRRDLMEMVAPAGPVYQAGTLSGNPLSTAAGLATLTELSRPGTYEELDRRGALLEEGLRSAAEAAGVTVTVQRVGSMLTPFFTGEPVRNLDDARQSDTKRFATFFHAMLDEGVSVPPSQFEAWMVSMAHTDDDLGRVVEAAGRAFAAVAD